MEPKTTCSNDIWCCYCKCLVKDHDSRTCVKNHCLICDGTHPSRMCPTIVSDMWWDYLTQEVKFASGSTTRGGVRKPRRRKFRISLKLNHK